MFNKLFKSKYVLQEFFSFIPFEKIKDIIKYSKQFQKRINIKFEDYYFCEQSLSTIQQFHIPYQFIKSILFKIKSLNYDDIYVKYLISYSKEHDVKIIYVDKILEYRLLQEIPKNLCINFIEFPYFILKNPKDYIKNIKYLI